MRFWLVCTALVLVACSSTPASIDAAVVSDVGNDTFTPAVDSSIHIDANDTCDVSPAPDNLTALAGEFVILDADAGSPIPMQTGGDPTGVWRMSHVTFYTAPDTAGMYDPSMSMVSGDAWIVVTASELRLEMVLDLTLHTDIAGTIVRHQVTDVRGAYTVDGATLNVTPTCFAPAPMTAGMNFVTQFTSTDTDGTLVLMTSGMLGDITIVLTGSRMAS